VASRTQSVEESSRFDSHACELRDCRRTISVPVACSAMPLFWMRYKTAMDVPIGVLIVEAPDLLQARFGAAVFEIDRGADFMEGYALDPETAKLIPHRLIRRMVPLAKAADLLKEIESAEPTLKRPPAGSVRERTAPRRRLRGA
jgi:hypothetical protein